VEKSGTYYLYHLSEVKPHQYDM